MSHPIPIFAAALWFRRINWILALLASGEIRVDQVSHNSSRSAEQLQADLMRATDQVTSVHVKYRAVSQIDNPSEKYIVREIVTKQPCFMFHFGSHGTAKTSWQDDPGQQKAWILSDKYFNEFPLARVYFYNEIHPTDALPGTLQKENWFLLTGLWPLAKRKAPRVFDLAPMLNEVAKSSDYSIVRHQLELVDGHWCHVLERKGGGDTLWLDAERNSCLMKREVTDPGTGKLFGRIELIKQKQVSPDLWLPGAIRCLTYSWSTGEQKINTDFVTEISELSVNNVSDDYFRFKPRPGSMSYRADSPTSMHQTEPGGLEHLDDIAAWILRVYGSPEPPSGHGMAAAAYLIVFGAILLIVKVEFSRRKRHP